MGVFLAVFSFFGLTFQLSKYLNKSLEFCFPFVSASLILLLYMLGLVGFLFTGAKIILALGILFFLIRVIGWVKLPENRQEISYGLTFISLTLLVLSLISTSKYYSTFTFVDDFSHWGRVSKLLLDNNRLLINSDPIWFKDYPPGTALFNYYFLQLSDFSPSKGMFAQGILVLSLFAGMFSDIKNRITVNLFLLLSIFIFIIIHFFGPGLHTLSVDLIVGLFFGIGLLGYASERRSSSIMSSLLRVSPILIVLPLIKLTGLIFSFGIMGFALSEALMSSENVLCKLKCLLVLLILAIFALISHFSWMVYGQSVGVDKTFKTNITLSEIVRSFDAKEASSRQIVTIENFKRSVLTPYKNDDYLPYYWIFVLSAFLLYIFKLSKEFIYFMRLPFLILFAGFLGYLFILLLLYMFSFGAYEGQLLASFGRYINSYLFGILILVFGITLQVFLEKPRSASFALILILLGFLIVAPEVPKFLKGTYRIAFPKNNTSAEYVLNYARFVNEYVEKKANIYFLMQGSNGTENTIFNYEVLPRVTNRACWSVGDSYFDGDVWTCPKLRSELQADLLKYDYLFVGFVDDNFNQKYADLFANNLKNGQLYKVSIYKDKPVFELVGTYGGEILVPKMILKNK